MKTFLMSIALFSTFSTAAFAVGSPSFDRNLAMSCGNIAILTSEYTTRLHSTYGKGQLVAASMELGDVFVQVGNSREPLLKTEKPQTTILGKKKGYGVFENKNFRLDLSNTIDNYNIYLEDKVTGERVRCEVHGDCC